MLEEMLKNVREKSPLIHNITNYVTVNDCANVVLACGASPIMADDQKEVAEITSICTGLNINIGTLNTRTIESMVIAGKKANELHHPVVLDPVGVGASTLRTQTALKLLKEIQFSVIRGNISEIKTLALGSGTTKGVDANLADKVTAENIHEVVSFAQEFSKKTGAVIAITIDGKILRIYNGHRNDAIKKLSALTASFISANPDYLLESTVAAVCTMGLAGEIAHERLTPLDGNASYRNYIIDAIYNMTPKQLQEGSHLTRYVITLK